MDLAKREHLGLTGLLPANVETLDIQKARALQALHAKHNPLDKYIFMAQLRTSNVKLFYKIVMDDLEVSLNIFCLSCLFIIHTRNLPLLSIPQQLELHV
jgi:hypothetical protein